MRKSNFILLFKTLTEEEIKGFDHFLAKFHARQKVMLRVFNYIKNNASKSSEQALSKEIAIKSRYLKSCNFTSKGLSNKLSDLYKYLKEFLISKKIDQNEYYEKDFHLISILKDKRQDQLYFKKIDAVKKEIDDSPIINYWDDLKRFELNYSSFYHVNTKKLDLSIQSLDKGMQNLDLFYTLTKLKYACEMLNRSTILQETHTLHLLNESIAYCERHHDTLPALHQLYLLAYKLLHGNDYQVFLKLKSLLIQHLEVLPKEEKGIFIGYLINFIISRVGKDNNNYYREIFSLYRIALKEQLIIENNSIPSSSFINIVNSASSLKEFTWIENFIEDHKKYLAPDNKEQILQISHAYVAFEKNKFEKVLADLNAIGFHNHADFALRSKSLILKSKYELIKNDEDTDRVFEETRSFEIYLKRNKKINKQKLDAYLNFIKYTKQLLRKKINKEKTTSDINVCPNLYFRNWLLTKVREAKQDSL